jgi:SH3-like domain-containing protein
MRLWITACLPLAVWLVNAPVFADEPTPVVKCDVIAYMDDPDTNGLNVRAKPSPTAAIVGHIPDYSSSLHNVEFHITAASGKWLQIGRTETVDGEVVFKGTGWVYGPLTTVTASTHPVKLRERPEASGPAVAVVPTENGGHVLGCKGEWIKIRYKGQEGWMEPGSHCGNPMNAAWVSP